MTMAAAIDEAKGEGAASLRKAQAPERRCIVTRESAPRGGLVRFVLGPEAAVVPDLAETLPGRGVWVSADRAALEKARAKTMFAHAFRAPAKAPADLAERVERLLAERCIALIGFARRAGCIVFGRDPVRAAVAAGELALLLAASDSDGRDAAELRSRFDGDRFAVLTAAEIGAALGRAGIVHLGLKPGRLAEALARELRRLAGFRAGEPSEADAARAGRRHRHKE
jgi:predicted RNA-binding protein YlxR (DUF448 family)